MPLIRPKRSLVQRPSGPLAFPKTNPGFDPRYGGLIFSALPAGGNCISWLQGAKPGTVVSGNISASVNNVLGPTVTFPSQAGNNLSRLTFAGNNSTNFASSTIAAIFMFNGLTTTQYIFASDSGSNGGVGLDVTGAGAIQWNVWGGATKTSSITLVVNVPYFVVVSQNGTTSVDFFALRLDNGAISTSSTTGTTIGASNGTYVVGNSSGSGNPANGQIAAVAFLSGYNAPAVVQKWAADPWGLWYPQ